MTTQNIVKIDPSYVWCTQHLEKLLPFKNGFVAIRLPDGIIASGATEAEFEVAMKFLTPEQANNLYVTHAGIFFDDFKIPLRHWDYS